jgi:hypothetical protein
MKLSILSSRARPLDLARAKSRDHDIPNTLLQLADEAERRKESVMNRVLGKLDASLPAVTDTLAAGEGQR